LPVLVALVLSVGPVGESQADGGAGSWEDASVEAVRIIVTDTEPSAERTALEDRVRRALAIYPGTTFKNLLLDWGVGKVRAIPGVAAVTPELSPGTVGGVVVTVRVAFAPGAEGPQPPSFPYLFQDADSLLKVKVRSAGMVYANHDAWYGDPPAFVGANPLADAPSGEGWGTSLEGYTELGLQGIGPIAPSLYAYGSLSYVLSGTVGQELFTDAPRGFGGIEDAFAGIVTGKTWEDGSRLVVNLTAGRQPFQIADGMLIRLGAGNGFERAALQLNPRIAADNLFMAEARYNTTRLQVFQLDPDENEEIDTRTLIDGINLDAGLGTATQFGLTYLNVPRSAYGYYTPTAIGTRAGLNVIDGRFYWLPTVEGASGPYARSEFAFQWNDENSFPMRAWGGYGEAGYTFAGLPWRPTVSVRLSGFSGDDPDTETYERWDPLLSGGTPEEWVQGINHYKMFQDTNLTASRFQARLRPAARWELVPQFWLFSAAETNNLGGSLAQLASRPLGYEVNLTAKYFPSRSVFMQAGIAATFPRAGVADAIPSRLDPWISASALVRVAY
jgi:hypothetical protein